MKNPIKVQSRTQSMPVRRLGAGHDSGETECNYQLHWREINDTDTGNWYLMPAAHERNLLS